MDCRKWLWLGLAGGVVGCGPQSTTLPVVQTTPRQMLNQELPPPGAEIVKEKDLPKRLPKASTCVVFGDFRAKEADETPPSAMRDELREQARRAYQQALEIEPENLAALQSLARLYAAQKDHEKAIATYRRAVQTHPKAGELWQDLGIYQSQNKDFNAAADSLRQALACEPENRTYANMLGHILARAGRYDESFAVFEKTVGPAQAHYNLARMRLHLNQEGEARQHLQLALQVEPQHAGALQLLAQIDKKAPASGSPVEASRSQLSLGLDDTGL
jgi:tetratricopeptide (TPR) repeat protein